MYEYLKDFSFLEKLDKNPVKTQYIKILLLSFDEQPIKEIQGSVLNGQLNINGEAAIRRTINLTMQVSPEESNLTNIDNIISINKKIKIFIGQKNTVFNYPKKYDDIIWFPCGIFVISSANISRNITGQTITISAKDKMALLDGSAGGVIPAPTVFDEIYETDEKGELIITNPTIYQIIKESVNHFGGEPLGNIVINDLEKEIKMLISYQGEKPFQFSGKDGKNTGIIFENLDPEKNTYYSGDDVGYQNTPFTYPGELVLDSGSTVVDLLNKICQVLGNYEFFYDIDGKFIFQEKKNFLNQRSINLAQLLSDGHYTNDQNYIKAYNQFIYNLSDMSNIQTIGYSPSFENIKNEFLVWGEFKRNNSIKVPIRYHLVIDTKPKSTFYQEQMIKTYYKILTKTDISISLLPGKEIKDFLKIFNSIIESAVLSPITLAINNGTEWIYDQKFNALKTIIKINSKENKKDEDIKIILNDFIYSEVNNDNSFNFIISKENGIFLLGNIDFPIQKNKMDWREEIYRMALLNNESNYKNYYSELINEWRKIFNPNKWDNINGHWTPDIQNNIKNIHYWFDFIDTNGPIGKYSVTQIGRRTKVITDNQISTIYNNPVPEDIIFGKGDSDFKLSSSIDYLFHPSTSNISAYEKIKELLYNNLNYNTTITITCLPKYYLEVNRILRIRENSINNIMGDYMITSISIPLKYSGIMTINANEIFLKD